MKTMARSKGPDLAHRAALALAVLAAACVLAGCGALPDKPQRAALYDFGPGLPGAAAPAAPASAAPLPPILLADIDSSSRLDGTQVLYRLAYADANELRPYAQARWSVAPAQLLRQRLRDALAARRVVLGPEESANIARTEGKAPNALRVTLEEFSHYFASPGASVGLVRVRATLVSTSAGGDRVLGQRTFTAQQPAASADAPGGVKALAAASDAVVAQVVQWADQLQP
ncbi:ABC-type transport auxiliary lipoprotein family protein [Variovorax sp. J22R133]|uniref:ABC-type transport auxiliary lipoprotein family protein n=1 Tax=Variovorax brevis TaxID=3053503 RepID=UPI002577E79F|nr:ABC-type transport auxiliary lipoprotein family protein [Variovorax sp. J22R133]MDM0117410.1 ABC-type transport auxiliary lipoprotein family protein [Variovorax sp. J22R133]